MHVSTYLAVYALVCVQVEVLDGNILFIAEKSILGKLE